MDDNRRFVFVFRKKKTHAYTIRRATNAQTSAVIRIATGNGRNDLNIGQVKIRETEISPNNP